MTTSRTQTFTRFVNRWLTITTASAIIVMMLHIVTHAVARSVFNTPIYGTNEIVEYWYLPIVALLGIPAAQLQKEHITVTLAVDRARPATAAVFRIFACLLGVLVSLAFAWFGLTETVENTAIGSTADVSAIITWPVYFLVPVVFVLLAVLYVLDAVIIAGIGRPEPDIASTEPDIASTEPGLTTRERGLTTRERVETDLPGGSTLPDDGAPQGGSSR